MKVSPSPPHCWSLHKSGSGHTNLALGIPAGHCGQRMNQGSFPLSCVRRLEEATSLPFLISFRSLSYNFSGCRSCPSPHIMDMCLLLPSMRLHIVGLLSHSFQGSGSGFLTMSPPLVFDDTLAYASVLECSESQRLHNETRYGRGGGAEWSGAFNLRSYILPGQAMRAMN